MLDKIIHSLRSHQGYLSGEELSRSLSISRAGIWKHIQELRERGYDIVAVPHLGYQLVSAPDKLFPWEIKFDLKTKRLGKEIIYYDTVSSTMDEAFRLGVEGAAEGTVVCAEGQTQGRGRLGRSWVSPKGKGIYFSVILRPILPPQAVSQLTLLSAIAVSEAIKNRTGVSALIKWPNDLLVNNKKLVGILTELSADTDRVKFVVIGVGVNISAVDGALPAHATSLKKEAHKNFSRVELLQEILRCVEEWYVRFQKEGPKPIIKRWKELAGTLGSHIRISNPGETIEGKAIDIDQDGGLLIRKDSGIVVKKMTGDVVQVS